MAHSPCLLPVISASSEFETQNAEMLDWWAAAYTQTNKLISFYYALYSLTQSYVICINSKHIDSLKLVSDFIFYLLRTSIIFYFDCHKRLNSYSIVFVAVLVVTIIWWNESTARFIFTTEHIFRQASYIIYIESLLAKPLKVIFWIARVAGSEHRIASFRTG